jgi:drug/metabolite transporter superfamily protein YnfA
LWFTQSITGFGVAGVTKIQQGKGLWLWRKNGRKGLLLLLLLLSLCQPFFLFFFLFFKKDFTL